MAARILAFCGSARKGSLNQKILDIAIEGAREAGAEVTSISLGDYPMPIYHGDDEVERGLPEKAIELREVFRVNQGLLIGCPEYNGGVTALLKNAIDWVSRPYDGEPNLAVIAGKVVALVSGSGGMMGGGRAQAHMRQSFQVMQCLLVPQTASVPLLTAASFGEDGTLKDAMAVKMAGLAGRRLAQAVERMGA
jgi:NAD(P)H-dependent FMN reductase